MQHQPIAKFTQEHMAAREKLLNDALRAGKIQLASWQRWEQEYDCDPEGTATVLATLASAPGVAASTVATPEDKRYEPHWLTEGERRRASGAGTAAITTMND